MRQLLDEALVLGDLVFCKWTGPEQQRLDEIWEELKKPYAHLYGRHIGDQVGPGWWEDLLTAFQKISDVMAQFPGYRFRVAQIKEKFGTLRFYYDIHKLGEDEEQWPMPDDEVRDKIHQQVRDIVIELESATSKKCEECGEPGEMRNNGWIKTLCDKHDAVQKEHNKKRFG